MSIWSVIYKENCLLNRILEKGIDKESVCSEETLLFQLISGLHSSINLHVAHKFFDMQASDFDPENPKHHMNYDMYYYTVGM
eukprot:CAMPEP_0202976738 /NCGR_PEP_ID=MMETSP1396-20130829/80097_1 /ASSEMBLY_ACC=CAM_ASM_000872 /TAXON_ID= /ORGANISM="Pseudokeronopsis sp., Strain Brazil" /LENGTH=81 /DNA_ID=CAMNT_0049714591 /DNA_START=1 /DNA_END=243 /DNA_ORIENTATION=+